MKVSIKEDQLVRIADQAIIYQCACPAQVAQVVRRLIDLYEFQQDCLDSCETDKLVHAEIALATQSAHALMEDCLYRVLKLEGWDLETLEMPKDLQKRLLERFAA